MYIYSNCTGTAIEIKASLRLKLYLYTLLSCLIVTLFVSNKKIYEFASNNLIVCLKSSGNIR